jgi:translocation and assembly module TamB
VIGSPDLTYHQSQGKGQLTGHILIPKALFNGDEFRSTAHVSSDVIWVNQSNQPLTSTDTFPFSSRLTLSFGPKVSFQWAGIKTHVHGTVTLISEPNQAPIASGKLLSSEGSYEAYGKLFTITQGMLDFSNSPIENPGLDITAEYQLAPNGMSNHLLTRLKIGIKMTGTLKNRTLTLFSDPPLSQEDILSYIVLGQPLSQIQQSDQSAISKAAALFVLQGGNRSVLTDVQSTLGLSQLTIGSFDQGNIPQNSLPSPNTNDTSQTLQNNNTAVFIGKSLNPNLFLSYGVGLFNKQQEVSLSVHLSRHWTLKTTGSSADSGVDLIYTLWRM